VREYRTLVVGGLVFVLFSEAQERGLTAYLEELDRTSYLVPGFSMTVAVSADLVVENGFDNSHFRAVHMIGTHQELVVRPGEHGELTAEGLFELPRDAGPPGPRRAGDGPVRAAYRARAFSPWVIISEVQGEHPYSVITAATPAAGGSCVIRLSLVVPVTGGAPPSTEWCQSTLRHSRHGLELDRVVWENMSMTAPVRLTGQDASIAQFRAFVQSFEPSGADGNQ
jgi:phenylpropionate dioxygenase-like ring-hydroxylating dioxygenase large terminal subunit